MLKFNLLWIPFIKLFPCCGGLFDWDNSVHRLAELNQMIANSTLWDNPQNAQKIMQEQAFLDNAIRGYNTLESRLNDAVELIELGMSEGDADVVQSAEQDIMAIATKVARLRLEALLSGEADGNNCFLEIHAGAGGTESCDWAQMLFRMYTRWAEQNHYKWETIECNPGEEAGIKTATLKISGHNAYGWLKTEAGVHRLVRISPFDSSARRHTSFTSVGIYPEINDTIDIEILDKDLKIDTYRASGAGGQHVNTTDSAVRITHQPSGIVVTCQNQRSQHKNRDEAMKMLKARLYEQELQKREAEAQSDYAEKTEIGWGHQIRSYVLHPYQMVKDLRTSVEKGNAQKVLDGDLNDYLEASLAHRVIT